MKIELTSDTATMPTYGSDGAAGMDLYAANAALGKYITLPAGQRGLIPLGLKMEIPEGYYGKIQPRSGMANKAGIVVLAGVIDSDYRGEVGVILLNTGDKDYIVEAGARIAQMIITPYVKVELTAGSVSNDTERGVGGFGSTGV